MIRSVFWAGVGVAGQQVMRLMVMIVLSRMLSPAAFGVVAVAQTVLSFADVLQKMGLGAALIQTDRLTKRMERSAVTLVSVSSLLMCLIIWLFTDHLAVSLNTPQLPQIMPLLLVGFAITSMNGPSILLLNREMRFRELAIAQIGTYIVAYGGLAILLAQLGYSYWALVWASVAQAAIYYLISHVLRPVWPTLRPSWEDLKILFNFGAGQSLAQILNNLARRGDNIVVAATLGPTQLGHYSRAYGLMDLANQLIGTVLYKVLFPAFSRQRREGTDVAIKQRGFLLSQFFIAALMSPVAVLMALLAPEIVDILLGPQWILAGEVLRVLGAAMYFRLGYKVSGAFVTSEGAVYRGAAIQGAYAATAVLGAWLGSAYGVVGVAYGITTAVMVQFVLLTWLAKRLCGVGWRAFLGAMVPSQVVSLVALTPILPLYVSLHEPGESPLLVVCLVAGLYYALFSALLLLSLRFAPASGMDWEMLKTIAKRVRKEARSG